MRTQTQSKLPVIKVQGRAQHVFMENGHLNPSPCFCFGEPSWKNQTPPLQESPCLLLDWSNTVTSPKTDVLSLSSHRWWVGVVREGWRRLGTSSHKTSLCKEHLSDFSTVVCPEGPHLHPMLQRDEMAPQDHRMQDKPWGAEFSLGHMILGKSLTF